MQAISNHTHRERGQSLVELALTFTVILLLLAGAIDFGRAFFTFVSLRDAAQEGASYGSINPTDTTGIISRAEDALRDSVDPDDPNNDIDIVVTILGAPCLGGTNAIQLDVTYNNFQLAMPFLGTVLGSQEIPIHATVNDTILRPTCGE
jgi:Flp pilus assembly protein TadG